MDYFDFLSSALNGPSDDWISVYWPTFKTVSPCPPVSFLQNPVPGGDGGLVDGGEDGCNVVFGEVGCKKIIFPHAGISGGKGG